MIQHHFILINDDKETVDRFVSDFNECRRRGDALASKLERPLRLKAYNEDLRRWDSLGVFRGNRQYTDSFGDERIFNSDYSGFKKGGLS